MIVGTAILMGLAPAEAAANTLYACFINETDEILYPAIRSQDIPTTTLTLEPSQSQVIKFNVDRHYGTGEARRQYELQLGRPIKAIWTNYDGNADTLPDGAACQYGAHTIRKVTNGYEIVWGKYVWTQ
jgi:hypothetical protein